MSRPTKTCRACGRTITWRKAWERDWDQVRYCSAGCRSRARRDAAQTDELRDAVRAALAKARAGASVCPSQVARAVADPDGGERAWRALMEPVRRAARLLAADGECEFLQGGHRVDPSTAKGPIRLRRL